MAQGQSTAAPVVFSLDPPPAHLPARSPRDQAEPDTGQPHTRVRTQWIARLATPTDAELLNIPRGTVVLHIQRIITDPTGQVVKATTTLCPADRTVLHHSYPVRPSR